MGANKHFDGRFLLSFRGGSAEGTNILCIYAEDANKGVRWMPWHEAAMKDAA